MGTTISAAGTRPIPSSNAPTRQTSTTANATITAIAAAGTSRVPRSDGLSGQATGLSSSTLSDVDHRESIAAM